VVNSSPEIPYKWSQTLSEAMVIVPIPDHIRSRDIECTISKTHLMFKIKGQQPLIDGELYKPVKVSDSGWQIEESKEGKAVVIDLSRVNKMEWWKCVIIGHPEVDTTKLEPENSKLGDLDDDTRGIVQKMMFDQRQKQMGLPTSDELNKQDVLNKFMAQHPEMDFSNVKMS